MDRLSINLKNILPQSLLGRTTLIVIFPFIMFQLIILSYYYNSLWERNLLQLSRSIVTEINLVSNIFISQKEEFKDKELIEKSFGMNIFIHSDLPSSNYNNQKKEGIILKSLRTELRHFFKSKIYINEIENNNKVSVIIPVEQKYIQFIFYKKRITTSRNHIFLGWQLISSLILILISMIFLKNQIKPIMNLARAAEDFGKGIDKEDFKVSGASEVRLAATEFLKMKNRILRQIEQRSMMLAGVSHDLKTPLTRIRLQTETIKDNAIKESLNDEVKHMNAMLSEYLEFYSIEQNTTLESINPIDAINKIRNDINFKDKNIDIVVKRESSAEVNSNYFNRIIVNLLNNSFVFASKIKIVIDISAKLIKINIHDDGPGISDDEKENVFKPFYRIDKSRNQNHANSGLGLSITKSLLSKINGTINLNDSSLGGLEVEIEIENK